MRSWILLFALVAPAAADEIVPSVTDPAAVDSLPKSGPFAYQAVASISQEHSCSQSFEANSYVAKLTLAVDAAGHAMLTLEGSERSTFGPAAGNHSGGNRDFTHRSDHSHASFSGTASRSGEQLVLDLHAERGAPFQIRCGVVPLDVGKSWQDERLPARANVLLCDGIEALVGTHFYLSVGDQLAFGRGAGFEVSISRMDYVGASTEIHFSRAM